MKTLSFWKKSIYSALVFFGTIVVLTVGYAVWNSPYTMSTVGSGSGLTANGWNALVNNIDDLNTRIIALSSPRGTLQYVQNHSTTPATYVGSSTRPGTEVTALATTITTTVVNSQIIYDLLLSWELTHDNTFILQRDIGGVITELGAPASVGAHDYGIVQMTYDPDNNSTPNQISIQFIDTPNVPTGTTITYRLRFYGDGSTLSLNKTSVDNNLYNYERITSNVRLEEFKP